MRNYLVGGFVRDTLLGLEVKDRDFVVVGATSEDMRAQGFTQVGADFPVFLHPQTHEEYALARTERKSAQGYHGFEVNAQNVTLEEDLSRRDLTINSMAMDESRALIDPYNGQADLQNKVLRHVGPAFTEDPVRVLRVLRFLARFGSSWTIAPETQTLIADMVSSGVLHHLTAERVWKEVARGLLEPHPQLMLQGMVELGLHQLPCFAAYSRAPYYCGHALKEAAAENATLETRFCLAFANGPSNGPADTSPVTAEGRGTKTLHPEIPRSVKVAAESYQRLLGQAFVPGASALRDAASVRTHWSYESTLSMVEDNGGFRNKENLTSVIHALALRKLPLAAYLKKAWELMAAVDTSAISSSMPPGPMVGVFISRARMSALEPLINSTLRHQHAD